MSEQLSYKDVERRTLQMINFEDGLWDLLLGSVFLALAVYPITRRLLGATWNLILFLVVLAAATVCQQWVRRRVAGPRMGRVKPRRTPKLRIALIVVSLLVLATLGLVVLTLLAPGRIPSSITNESSMRSYTVDIVVAVVIAAVFSLMAYLFSVPRLYLYGVLIGVGNLASVFMEHTRGWQFNLPLGVAAAIIIAIGVQRLIGFLGRYPLTEQDS